MRRTPFLAAFFATATLLAAQQTTASHITFAATGDLHFGTMDLVSGNFNQTGPDLSLQLGGLGFGADGKLYGLDAGNFLVRIDPGSGVATPVGYSGIPLLSFQPEGSVIPFAATADGTLYGVSPDNALYKFDPASGAATKIGPTGVPTVNIDDPTVNLTNGLTAIGNTLYFSFEVYHVDANFTRTTTIYSNALYSLNTATGAATKVADIPSFTSVFSGAGGKLWGFVITPQYTPAAIETIDPKTGAIAPTVNNPTTLPFGAVPATPAIAQGGIANAASGATGIAPGAWISIYGADLATGTAVAGASNLVNGSLPTALGGATVTVNGKPAFLMFASPAQINLETPADTATGPVNVVVTNSTGSITMKANLQPVLPGLFAAGNNVLAVRPQDGVVINGTGDPVGGYPTAAAAEAGDTLELFATGLGATATTVAPGLLFSGAYPTVSLPTVTVGGASATVLYSGLIGAALYQINVILPASLKPGSYPVVVTQNGVSSPAAAMLHIAAN